MLRWVQQLVFHVCTWPSVTQWVVSTFVVVSKAIASLPPVMVTNALAVGGSPLSNADTFASITNPLMNPVTAAEI
jgi:hypothetical protein